MILLQYALNLEEYEVAQQLRNKLTEVWINELLVLVLIIVYNTFHFERAFYYYIFPNLCKSFLGHLVSNVSVNCYPFCLVIILGISTPDYIWMRILLWNYLIKVIMVCNAVQSRYL